MSLAQLINNTTNTTAPAVNAPVVNAPGAVPLEPTVEALPITAPTVTDVTNTVNAATVDGSALTFLERIGEAFQTAFDSFIRFLPEILAAIIVLVAGWIIAVWSNFFWTRDAVHEQIRLFDYSWILSETATEAERISFVWPVVIGAVATCIIGYCVSLLFPKPPTEKLTALTFYSFRKKAKENDIG